MGSALGWGALAASSLVLGALLGLARTWPDRAVGLVLAFGAGALISAVSFDLWEEGSDIGDPGYVGLGLAVGAATYFAADRLVGRPRRQKRTGGDALGVGAVLGGVSQAMGVGLGIAPRPGGRGGVLVGGFFS